MEDGSSTASEEFISGQRSQDIQHISSPQDDLSISCSFSLDRNTHFLTTDNESVVGICNEKNVKIPSNEKCSLQNPTRVNGEVEPTVSSVKKDVAVEERAPAILCGNTIEDSNWEHCLISRPDTIIVSEVSVQEHSHKEENVITFFDNKESNVFSEPGSENVCEKPFSETEITSKVTSAYNVTDAKEKETEECASGSNSPEHAHNSAEEKTIASPTEIYASGSNSPEHAHNSAEEKTTASPKEIYASESNSPEHAHNSAEEKTTDSLTEIYASGSNSPEHAHNSAEEKTTASPTEIYTSGSNSPEHAHNSAEEKTTASPTEIYASGNIEDEMKPKKNSSLESVSLIGSKESEDNKNNLTESSTPLQIENKYYSESSNSCVNSEEVEIKINIEKSCPDNVFMLTSERKVKQNILLKEKKSASKVEELCDEKDLEDTNSECSSEATNFQKQDHDTHISDLEPCTSSDERRYSHTATISDLEPSTSSDEQKYSNMTDVETCRSSSANEQKYSHETYIPNAEPDEINNLDDTQIVEPVSENNKSKLLVYCEPLHDEEESMSSVESNICANDKGVDDGKQKYEDCINYKVVKNENEIKGEGEHVLSQQPGSLNENELNLSSGKTFDGVTNKINERGKLLIKDTFESNPEHCEKEPTLLSENMLTENPTCREVIDSEIGREHSKTSENCVIDCELDKGFLIAISNTTINDKAGNNIKENLNDVSYEKDNSNNKSDEIKELTNEPTFMTKSKKRKPGPSPIYEKIKIAKLDTTACVVTKDTEGEKNLLSETLPISHIKNHKRKLISPVEYSIQHPTEECSYKEDSDVYKGFKKRILAQTSSANDNISLTAENHHLASLNTCDKSKIASLKKKVLLDSKSVILSNRKEGNEPNAQLEYAQYLGLQPTVKFKCYKCGDSSFPSMPKLQEHQIICLKNVQAQQPLPKQNQSSLSDPSASTNFRITRKVYLCSACGTYYENWNLFLHMREVHNRHICLYCLSMFSQADKLATHLGNKHSLPESVFVSPEQFHAEFKGPCFLMCCKCEQMFSESNFYKHPCKDLPNGNVEELCASCGLKGSHTSTCKDNLCNNNLTFSKSITSVPQVNEKTKPISNIQCSLQEHSNPATKYLIPLKKVSEKKKTTKILPEIDNDPDVSQAKSRDLSDVEDDYDISNAASFCHVNIHEPTEKQTSVTSKVKTYAKGKSLNVVKKCVEDIKTTTTPSESSKQQKIEDNVSINNQPQKCKTNEIYNQNLTQQDENEKNPSYPNESVQFESNNSSDGKISQILSENKEAKSLDDENDIVDSLTTEVNPRTSPTISLNSDVPLNSSLEVLSQPNDTIVANANTPESQSLFCENLKEESKSNLIIESESKTHFTTTGKHSNTSTDTKEKESQSDTSGSEDKTRDTNEIFTSSSDVSSDEIESEQSKCAKKILLQASSEEDSSSSDKMSLVVDENDDKTINTNEDKSTEKLLIISNKNHGEKWPTNLSGLKEMATVGTLSENQEKGILETDNLEIINEKLDLKFDNKQKSQENLSGAEEEKVEELSDNIQIAGEDTPLLELILEQSLDKMTTHDLLKESVKVSCISCVYCNHAKKIAVNAKQLSLHLLAEHRFSPVLYFDISEPVEVEGFVPKLKTAATELQNMFLNTDTYDSSNKDLSRPYDRTYECFHCHFLTTSHKELYLHNRKMHQKTILLCIMCKSNFYSYSELLCHLCPGIYLPDSNINFRCCLCAVDGLPSAFRLMVHLRKRHNACDVCLETTGDQQKLSNHVWKHKLHHLCYRCGIAYRNKPDITKHLFWKHGTESVLCKKCLQKKWPHVYHFCIPPNAFVCEECNVSFSKAVALKVHKRLHVGDIPYACEKCEERFISRSLLNKHMKKHEPVEFKENISNEKYLTKDMTPETVNNNEDDGKHKLLLNMDNTSDIIHKNEDNTIKAKDTHDKEIISATKDVNTHAKPIEGDCILNNSTKSEGNDVCGKKVKVVDVYDLPPLNLSSDSDDSDGDIDHMTSTQIKESRSEETTVLTSNDKINDETPFADENQTIQVVDGVWDNFNTFQLNMEKKENKILPEESESYSHLETLSFILLDHNYCGPAPTINQTSEETVKDKPENVVADKVDVLHLSTTEAQDKQEDDKKNMDVDHNYCFNNSTSLELNDDKEKIIAVVAPTAIPSKKKVKTMKKKQKRASSSSSDSSSNSDSTSCSCGTNCSCSSSSSSSSGSSSSPSSDSNSSSSESRRKQAARREKRKERSRNKKKKEENNTTVAEPVPSNSTVIGVPNVDYALQGNVTLAQEETELPIRESDLDTDETETDEDFYDQHPQKLANKLLAEKRNQLLLLAAVAPVNNGTVASSSSTLNVLEQGTTSKKKVKSKRRKKSQYQDSAPSKMMDNSLKLDIPSTYYDSQTTIYSENNTMQATTLVASPLNTLPPNLSARKSQVPFSPSSATTTTPTLTYHSTGSGSETDSKRLSRRRRVPKRFYGDSSDEDEDSTLQPKWVKLTPSPLPSSSVGSYKIPVPEPQPVSSASQLRSEEEDESESEREDNKKSISESSLSDSDKDNNGSDVDSDVGPSTAAQTCTEVAGDTVQQKSDNLYCYCQCPYDEVSEMIACDGKDCSIEWFHFECVGIMVPPKGKWFCPDCRKKQSSRSEYLLHT